MKYNISKDFKKLILIKPPIFKLAMPVANTFISLTTKINQEDFIYKEIKLEDITIQYFSPKTIENEISPCLIYFHGGGFMFKANKSKYELLQEYSIGSNCKIISIDYRLTPKYTYPSQILDCLEGYKYTIDNSKELKIDKKNIVIGGDSAGGSLALDTYLMSKKQNLPDPKGLLLIYPVVDNLQNTESMKKFQDTPCWNSVCNKKMWEWYLDGKSYTSPLKRIKEFNVKNIFIELEEFDCLHDEGYNLYKLLEKTTKNIVLLDNKKTIHGYDIIRNSKITKRSIKRRISFLKNTFK